MEKEIWVPVGGYEGLYKVSNYGRVMSLGNGKTHKSKRILSPAESSNGYLQVELWKNGQSKTFLVHRLVAQAFIPNWFGDPQVNHIDENKQNNHVENLEFCDGKYNINYGTRNERSAKSRSKPVLQLTKKGELVREWPSTIEAGRNGLDQGNIVKCCLGERKSHKGFIWKYKEVS